LERGGSSAVGRGRAGKKKDEVLGNIYGACVNYVTF